MIKTNQAQNRHIENSIIITRLWGFWKNPLEQGFEPPTLRFTIFVTSLALVFWWFPGRVVQKQDVHQDLAVAFLRPVAIQALPCAANPPKQRRPTA